jgi:hypothetical protein
VLLGGVTTAEILLYLTDIHPKFWTIFETLEASYDEVETSKHMAQFRARCYFVVEMARLASIDPKYNLMFEWAKLNEAQKEEKEEEVGRYKEELDGLVSTKLDLEGIYGSTNALPYGKQCPRFHMF